MTPEHQHLVRLSFVQVMDRKMDAGRMFYERLFAIAPETRPLFKIDVENQARKLMDTLAVAISSLRDMPSLLVMLETMAIRHVSYGVRDEHYDKVGDALLWTLERVLGANFTPEVRAAWVTLYQTVASVMRNAAKNGRSVQPAAAM